MRAALEGYVTDSTGGAIEGAAVTARDVATRQSRALSTNDEGRFRFAELPAGTYEVTVTQSGFGTFQHAGVALPLGSTIRLDVTLQPASVGTQVAVTAQPSAIDPEQTSVTTAVDTERIEELPVESRNYLNFVLLAPGVTSSGQQAGRPLAALPDSGFSFGGLRGRSNNVAIDGLDNNDEYLGASRTELSLETIQEFQVVNTGLSAASGGASGGSINVVTRTGANNSHGDAFVFAQNGSLDARNPFETEHAAPSLHRYRAGGALGGALIRSRTFYYAAFEQESSRGLDDSFLNPALAASINRIIASGVFPRLSVKSVSDNFFPVSRAETEASAKINHQLSDRNSLMLRYAFTNNRESGDAFNTAGWTDASARGSSFTSDQAVVGALTTVFDGESVGDLRFQIAGRRATLRTNDAVGPGIDIAGLAEFGRPYDGNGTRAERHTQINYTYTRSYQRHLLKAGMAANRVHEDSRMGDGFGGYYIFASLATFAAGQPNEFRQAFGSVEAPYGTTNLGGFVTDHWSATRKLTVDLGVRYDIELLPGVFREDTHNVSPRIGLAYQIAPSWVTRAGYGIFYDRFVLSELNRVLQKDGVHAFEQVLWGNPGAAAFEGGFGGVLTSPLPAVGPSIYTADPRLGTPYSQQASFAIEHLLAHDLTATASYLFVRGVKLARTRNVNFPLSDAPTAQVTTPAVYQLEDAADSTYNGMSLALNRRMSDEFEFSVGYTLSKTFDNASDFTGQPQDPWNLASERALSLQDQRHRLSANALWELPIGDAEDGKPAKDDWVTRVFGHIELAPIFTLESGHPVNPLTGIDSNGSLPFPLSARPSGFGRNSLKRPMLANMDLRVLKYFPFGKTAHLDLVAEAFNLFNRSNVAEINPVFGGGVLPQPGFLQPLTGTGARRIQFSLDFEF